MTLLALLVVGATYAAEPALLPGDYVTEGGWGNLNISRGKTGSLDFSIGTIGANAHMCNLEGEIRNGRATLEADEKSKPCIVTFNVIAAGIEVATVDSAICRAYCGARAHFEGQYLKPVAGCSEARIERTRKEFKQLYDRKNFVAARAKLEPVLVNCVKTLHWMDVGWIRNDLAITQYRLGDVSGCRRTLEPLAGDAAKSDDALRDARPPADADNWSSVVEATRTNLKLCSTAKKR